jgi:hypothetical protein
MTKSDFSLRNQDLVPTAVGSGNLNMARQFFISVATHKVNTAWIQ